MSAAAFDAFDAWFRLLETPGLGRERARRLLQAAGGGVEAVFETDPARLASWLGEAPAAALQRPPALVRERLDAARRWLDGAPAGGPPRRWLALGDPRYPTALLHAPDPPLLLYVEGDADALAWRGVAIVGSRHATAQGLDTARTLAAGLSRRGLAVFSGLAQGIDGAAHEGALAAVAADGGAPTVAVVGTGLDRVYPPRHAALAARIAGEGGGAVVSEFAPGTPPLAANFPQRNRILAGLSLGTVVVEAALRSGSLITARLAAEAGREVFAVPGSIRAEQSRGCHALLRQGAALVETVEDIVQELERPEAARAALRRRLLLVAPEGPADGHDGDDGHDGGTAARARTVASTAGDQPPGAAAGGEPPAGVDADGAELLRALAADPATLDELQARTGRATAGLAATLLTLELDGHVARLPGGRFQRRWQG